MALQQDIAEVRS